jgi:hypothetical protein
MLTAITLQNFKGIGAAPMRLPIKPITLLFGANSIGKSTIVQAIHYAREILERKNLDPDHTLAGGQTIDLGGFRNLVHDHDLNNPIVLRFDLDLSSTDLPEYSFNLLEEVPVNLSKEIKSAWVELTVEWSEYKNSPVLTLYKVGINDIPIAKIITTLDESNFFVEYDPKHPLLLNSNSEEKVKAESVQTDTEGMSDEEDSWESLLFLNVQSSLPQWGECLLLYPEEVPEDYLQEHFGLIMTQILVGPGEILREHLRRFRYLGPLRKTPSRNHHPTLTAEESLWADGTAAWDALYDGDPGLLEEVSRWMSDAELKTGYYLRLNQFHEIPTDSPLIVALLNNTILDVIENPAEEIKKYPVSKKLVLVEETKGLELLPQDVGVGISQVVPVIVAALDPGADIVAVEQPELHAHPALQVGLGDLLISQITKGKTFIIETHSEHLLLRLMRRIRETSGESLNNKALRLTVKDLSVLFFEMIKQQTIVREMPLNEQGELVKAWPGGFFEEGLREMF